MERWVAGPGVVCYEAPPAVRVDRDWYDRLRDRNRHLYQDFLVPVRSGRAWVMKQHELCRISIESGPQVGDVNFWNLTDTKERFYSGKTRQLHAAHLSVYDRLWSCLPYLRPMATVVADTIQYGVDPDGAGVHDVIGTRCDQYTKQLITGNADGVPGPTCHSNLTEAIRPYGLVESDVHDVWNIFMCTGFSRRDGKYFTKASPARMGDAIEFIADMDLLVALSTCPQGDVSTPVGKAVPEKNCHPLRVEVFCSS